ncbi:hypothetical protein [Bartonella sp. AA168HLJHH]|uniref:hypothetical protein n=1 Tax=Bartonella sp. AA168HLJHH TaxID=3243427 RepID=UPI0035CF74BF
MGNVFLKSYLTLAFIKVESIAPLSRQLIKNKLSFTLATINFDKALVMDKIYKKHFLSSMFLSHIGHIYDMQINDFDCFMMRAANEKV